MINKLLFLFVFLTSSISIQAQYRLDYGVMLGGTNYLGEIGGKDKAHKYFVADMKLAETKYAVGGFLRYKITHSISAKANLIYAVISGKDANSINPARVARNLSFKTTLIELSGQAEWNFYSLNDVGGLGGNRIDFRSYALIGIAGVYYTPKALYRDQWVKLRPLRTEGQLASYSPVTFAIPVGLGCYYTIKRKVRIGIEASARRSFTDYLDDISTTYPTAAQLNNDPVAIALSNRKREIAQEGLPDDANYAPGQRRGTTKGKDWYFFSTLTLSKVIRGKSSFYRSKYNFITGVKKKKRKVRAKF